MSKSTLVTRHFCGYNLKVRGGVDGPGLDNEVKRMFNYLSIIQAMTSDPVPVKQREYLQDDVGVIVSINDGRYPKETRHLQYNEGVVAFPIYSGIEAKECLSIGDEIIISDGQTNLLSEGVKYMLNFEREYLAYAETEGGLYCGDLRIKCVPKDQLPNDLFQVREFSFEPDRYYHEHDCFIQGWLLVTMTNVHLTMDMEDFKYTNMNIRKILRLDTPRVSHLRVMIAKIVKDHELGHETEASRTELAMATLQRIDLYSTISFYLEFDPSMPALIPIIAKHIKKCFGKYPMIASKMLIPGELNSCTVTSGHIVYPNRTVKDARPIDIRTVIMGYVGYYDELYFEIIQGNGESGTLPIKPIHTITVGGQPMTFDFDLSSYDEVYRLYEAIVNHANEKVMEVLQLLQEDDAKITTEYLKQGILLLRLMSDEDVPIPTNFNAIATLIELGEKSEMEKVKKIAAAKVPEGIPVTEDLNESVKKTLEKIKQLATKVHEPAGHEPAAQEPIEKKSKKAESHFDFLLFDTKYPYDVVRQDVQTSIVLSHQFCNMVGIRARFETLKGQNTANSTSDQIRSQITTMIGKYALNQTTLCRTIKNSTTGQSRTEERIYPYVSEMRTKTLSSGDICQCQASALVTFMPGSYDAVRAELLVNSSGSSIVMNNVDVYFRLKGYKPPSGIYPDIGEIKHIYGKDPRATPVWCKTDFDNAMNKAREFRQNCMIRNNEIFDHDPKTRVEEQISRRLMYFEVGLLKNPLGFMQKAERFSTTFDASILRTLEEINFVVWYLTEVYFGTNGEKLSSKLRERRIEIELEDLKVSFKILTEVFANMSLSISDYQSERGSYIEKVRKFVKKGSTYIPDIKKMIRDLHLEVLGKMPKIVRQTQKGGSLTVDDPTDKIFDGVKAVAVDPRVIEARIRDQSSTRNPKISASLFELTMWDAIRRQRDSMDPEKSKTLEVRESEDAARYASILETHASSEIITGADRLWALGYEKRLNDRTKRTFIDEAAKRKNSVKQNLKTHSQIDSLLALCPRLREENPRVYTDLTAFFAKLDSAHHYDFLKRIGHLLTSPKFRITDFPENIASRDLDWLYTWFISKKVVTSCAGPAEIEWNRSGCPKIFLEMIGLMTQDQAANEIDLEKQGDMYYDDQSIYQVELYLEDDHQRLIYSTMKNSVSNPDQNFYLKILKEGLIKGFDFISDRVKQVFFRGGFFELTGGAKKHIEKMCSNYVRDQKKKLENSQTSLLEEIKRLTRDLESIDLEIAIMTQERDAMAQISSEEDAKQHRLTIARLNSNIGELKVTQKELGKKVEGLRRKSFLFQSDVEDLFQSFYKRYDVEAGKGVLDFSLPSVISTIRSHGYPRSINDIEINDFTTKIVKKFGNMLDCTLYAILCKTGHYVSEPLKLPARTVPAIDGSAPAASEGSDVDSFLEISASEIDSTSETGDVETPMPTKTSPPDHLKIFAVNQDLWGPENLTTIRYSHTFSELVGTFI